MWGLDINFIVMQVQDVWICIFYDCYCFVVCGNFGWIEVDNFDKVLLDLCFFVGGDCSICGYKYKFILLKDDDGKLIGVLKLVIGLLEYQYNVSGKWWGVVFVDSGEVVSDICESDFKIGVGVGVCWQLLVGLIKLDIVWLIGDKEEYGLQFYIGLGFEL